MTSGDKNGEKNVLVVEDDVDFREFLVKIFSRAGFAVDSAGDGYEALELVEARRYDLMLLDYRMPGLSGLDTLSRLHAIGPPFPVILLSGSGSEEVAVQAMQMGAADYVIKTPTPRFGELLLEKANKAMERFVREDEQRFNLQNLRQRMAELGCLYALEKLFDSVEGSPRVALSTAADIVLPGTAADDGRCCAVIRIGKEEYPSATCFDSAVYESFDIQERGKTIGALEIRFREAGAAAPGGALLSEMERDLLMAVADRIGHFMDFWHTEQRLRESNAALEEYAYVASHDLQAPLQKIESFAQLLQEDYASTVDASGRHYLSVLVKSAAQMRRLIKDVLALARLDSAGLTLQSVDLARLMEGARDNLAHVLIERGAIVRIRTLPVVQGDETRLGQLFQNLIGNAVKFNDKPEPTVEVGALEEPEAWRIYVRDNGIGMSHEDARRIFLPFKRLHTSDQYEGTGIGLALCRKIARQHGGSIDVESEPGKGSTFWIWLPKHIPAFAPADVPSSVQTKSGDTHAEHHGANLPHPAGRG